MAELEYRFTEQGLSELRSEMQDLAEETEDVGQSADDTASDLEDMGDTDAAEDVSQEMQDAQEAVNDVGEEAQDTAQRLREEFEDASQEVQQRIEDLSGALTDFNEIGVELGGLQGGGGDGGGASAFTGAAIGLNAVQNLVTGLNVNSLKGQLGTEAIRRQMQNLVDDARNFAQIISRTDDEDLLGEFQGKAEQTLTTLRNMGDEGRRLADILDGIQFGTPGEDAFTEAEQVLENMGEEADGASGSMMGLGGAAGRVASKLGLAGASATSFATGIGAAGAAAAVATKQIADWSAQVAQAGQQLKVLEAQSGVAGTEAQELFQVAQQLDSTVDLDSIRDAFKELALRTQEAREGTGEAREAFDRLGISISELEGMSTAEVFQRVRQEAQKLTAQQRALTLEQVAGGEAGERLARVFGLQADEYQRLASSVSSLSSRQIATLDRLRTQYTQYNQKLRVAKQELAAAFGPPAVTLLNEVAGVVDDVTSVLADMVREWRRNAAAALYFFGILDKQGARDFMGAGRNPNTSGSGDGTAGGGATRQQGKSPRQRFGETLNSQARQIARIRQRAEEGLISEEEMLRQIVSARESTFKELQKIGQKAPDLFTEEFINFAVRQLKAAQRRLEEATASEGGLSVDPEQVTPAGQEQIPTSMPSPSASAMGGGLSSFRGAAEAADSVGDINSLIEATRAQFDTLNNDEAVAFIARLQKAKAEMQEAQTEAELIGDALARSVARSADRVFDALGQGISDAIFGGGSGRSTAQARLNLFSAKEQVRSLRKSLRQGNLSYRNFQLKMQAQQDKIQKRQEQLNDSMQSGFAQAAESMVSAFKQVAKQLIAEITAVVAKMLVLKAITSAFSIGSGGFLGSVISNLGGGAFLDSGASGGMVKQSGLAVIHENEQIMNAETVSMLDDLLQPSTPSAQPAAMGGGGMNVTVNVTGQTTTDGRDLKTAYDQTTRIQRRKGRRD